MSITFDYQKPFLHLTEHGYVYTLRHKHRAVGRTVLMHYSMPVCMVNVQRVDVKIPDELDRFVGHSGLDNVEEWTKLAAPMTTLYLVCMI